MLCSLTAVHIWACYYVKKNHIIHLNLVKIFTHKSHNRSNRRPSSPANGPQRLPSYLPKCAAPISRPFCHLTGVFNFNISLFYFRMLTRLWYPYPTTTRLATYLLQPIPNETVAAAGVGRRALSLYDGTAVVPCAQTGGM